MTEKAKHDKKDKELMSLIENKQLNYGYIICKCNLVDCIYMTKAYIKKIKKITFKNKFLANIKKKNMLGY